MNRLREGLKKALLAMAAEGFGTREIARALKISRCTVRRYRGSSDVATGMRRFHARKKAEEHRIYPPWHRRKTWDARLEEARAILLRVARGFRSRASVEEIESWVDLHKILQRYDESGRIAPFGPYCIVSIRGTILTAIKKQGLHIPLDEVAPPIDTRTPEQEAIERQRAREVREAFDELPAWMADVVRLQFFEGRPVAEVAKKLGLPLGTVLSRAYRARQHMKKRLRHWANPGGAELDSETGFC